MNKEFNNEIMDVNFAKSHAKLCVCFWTENQNDVVYRKMPELNIKTYVRIRIDENRSFKVTKSYLEHLGISEDEIFEAARNNRDKYTLRPMKEVLFELSGIEGPDIPVWVLTTEQSQYGASALCFKDELELCIQLLGNEFYIIPSSVHELLLMKPEDYKYGPFALSGVVYDINERVASESDRLCDSVILYKNGKLQEVG